jgi:hypothetical protein
MDQPLRTTESDGVDSLKKEGGRKPHQNLWSHRSLRHQYPAHLVPGTKFGSLFQFVMSFIETKRNEPITDQGTTGGDDD